MIHTQLPQNRIQPFGFIGIPLIRLNHDEETFAYWLNKFFNEVIEVSETKISKMQTFNEEHEISEINKMMERVTHKMGGNDPKCKYKRLLGMENDIVFVIHKAEVSYITNGIPRHHVFVKK